MYREELAQIAEAVWESVLQMQLEPAVADQASNDPTDLIASIAFSGAWEGEVVATLSEALARRMAGAMLASEPDELTREDMLDAVGEIVNMLGGNVKALMPPPCQLSLPRVAPSGIAGSPKTREWVQEALHFRCQRLPIEISLRAAPARPSLV
jgi:chemotaxis protein CheX